MTEIADHIKIRADADDDEGQYFDRVFPTFVWTIRDFNLDLEIDGQTVTEDGYLEHALKFKPGLKRHIYGNGGFQQI